MRRILSSVLVSSLLAMLAVAQSSRSVLVENSMRKASGHDRSARRDLRVYVITVDSQFGALNLRTGEFVAIPVSPGFADQGIGQGLVQGLGRSLLSLSFSGSLDKIDPFTGETSQIGTGTGLADCSLLGSHAPNCVGFIGQLGERLYATDFAQNLYSINPTTGRAKLIGPTGIPPIDFAPFSDNPDGSVNLFGESLFSAHGKLYAFFVTVAINFETGTNTPQISGAIYEINPRTGKTAPPIPTNSGLSHIVSVNDTTYGFDAWTAQVVTLELATGHTKPVPGAVVHGPGCEAGPPACVVAGATPVNPLPETRR